MANNKHQTLIFAHRGANLQASENTRRAFDIALRYPIDGIETDVQMSSDEVTVLWHDRYTDKLGYTGQHIDEFSFKQLQSINFAEGEAEFEGVLSLQEFISTYRSRCDLQIEIKNREWETVLRQQQKVRQSLAIIDTSKNMDVFISCFHLQSLVFAYQLNKTIPLFFSLEVHQPISDVEDILTKHTFLSGLCLPIQLLDKTVMQLIHGQDKKVLTYTCNSDADIQKALDLAVDILITDDPQKALHRRAACNETLAD